jgi:membrane fusion protein, multidrug efflux system
MAAPDKKNTKKSSIGLGNTSTRACVSSIVAGFRSSLPVVRPLGLSAGMALVFLTFSGCSNDDPAKAAAKKAPAPTQVVVANVTRQQVPLEVRAIGNIEAFSAVDVKSQVAGPIARVSFEEGKDVQKGQILFEIDPRPFQQAVQQAEAEVANRKAALAQAEANLERDIAQAKNARSQADRYASLTAKGIIAREQNEQFQTTAVAAEKAVAATKASIASARAAIQGAEAQLADARLQLSYATIRAPISGRAGNLTRKAGNLVMANNDQPLVMINQITPVYATFSIPEQSLAELRRYSSTGKLAVQAVPPNGGDPAEGVLDFLDNRVDTGSGTILLKARFPNQDRRLWPGQFVNVIVRLAAPTETVVPTAAVKNAQQGSYVFVVKPDSTAEQRTIEIARAWEDLTVLQSGLNPGERVIVEGQLRVKSGAKVRIMPNRKNGEGARARTAD